jgi:hypothetical protein
VIVREVGGMGELIERVLLFAAERETRGIERDVLEAGRV